MKLLHFWVNAAWKRQLALASLIAATIVALNISVAAAQELPKLVLPVPQRSQIDGTQWALSNCGPSSLAMVLEAFGDKVSNTTLRERANQLLGISDPDTGTRLEDLARIARERGLSTTGPEEGKKFRQWTAEEARVELLAGRPLLIQTYFPLLPNHLGSNADTDHYVVLVGVEGNDFIFNDPANSGNVGYHQKITEAELLRAWGASKFPFAGFSVSPGSAGKPLIAPAAVAPAPATSTPTPATSTPTPATSTPTPATSTPAPATSTPAPATSTPAPATSTPAPAASTPVSANTPVPTATATPAQPAAAGDLSAPVGSASQATAETVAKQTSTPVTVETPAVEASAWATAAAAATPTVDVARSTPTPSPKDGGSKPTSGAPSPTPAAVTATSVVPPAPGPSGPADAAPARAPVQKSVIEAILSRLGGEGR